MQYSLSRALDNRNNPTTLPWDMLDSERLKGRNEEGDNTPMNEKPFSLPMGFDEALKRLARVRRAGGEAQKKTPEKPKAARARVRRKSP